MSYIFVALIAFFVGAYAGSRYNDYSTDRKHGKY